MMQFEDGREGVLSTVPLLFKRRAKRMESRGRNDRPKHHKTDEWKEGGRRGGEGGLNRAGNTSSRQEG